MLPQTTPAQRLEMYEDVLELVTVGFLSLPVLIADTLPVSLRSLSDSDLFLIQQRAAFASEDDLKRWMLASSTWMVDGQVLLGDYNVTRTCFAGYQPLRRSQLDRMFFVVSGLLTRQRQCAELMEAFCLEPISRNLWRQTGGTYPSSNYNGLPTQMGMNFAQKIWLAHNRMEDLREQIEQDWNHAKLVASAMSPKGVEQLNAKESTHKETERDRKQGLMDRAFFKWIGYLRDDDKTTTSGAPKFKTASTPDELADEMRRWVAGEKDHHDLVVDQYKQAIQDAYDRDMQARRERLEEVQRNLAAQGESTDAIRLVGYRLDDLQDRVAPTHRQTVYEAPKGATYLHDKYLAQEPKVGRLAVQDGKVIVREAPPAPPLDELLADRKVEYGVGKR